MNRLTLALAGFVSCFTLAAQAQVVVTVDINTAPVAPPITLPPRADFNAGISTQFPQLTAELALRTSDSLTEGCFEPDALTNEVTSSLQRVDSLGQRAAASGDSQTVIALTSEFNRLEGLLNALIEVYGETIVETPTPACENLAESINALIEEIQAYLDVLEQQLFSLLW